ncbi:MAG TPA: cytochrome b/b6 domain-containing protein [Gammaproteobacteria bacterium]
MEKLVRHALVDRLLHWLTAACVIVLLATAFLPILGVEFGWVTIHWVTGLILTASVIAHIIRASFWKRLSAIWIGRRDLRDGVQLAKWSLRLDDRPPPLPGKFSLAQKAIHHAFSVVVLTTIVTGALMLVKIDTPWWERNPYWLGEDTWGVIYVLHDLGALLLVTMVLLHVYFALRPEKLLFTRAMILGWITREELTSHHDPDRWRAEPE